MTSFKLAFTTSLITALQCISYSNAFNALSPNYRLQKITALGLDKSNLSRRDWLKSSISGAVLTTTASAFYDVEQVHAFDKDAPLCDPTVSVFTKGGRIIYLVGTAHISEVR